MAFNALGFTTLGHIGSIDGSAGSMRSLHTYITDDDATAMETSGYFNAVASRIKTGDLLNASLDNDGTQARKDYVMKNTSGTITVVAAAA